MQDRLHSVTLQQLRVFAAVARERSFARAAEAMDLSPPTVSEQISSLEQSIGLRLIHRSRGRRVVELTEAGTVLLQSSDEISQSLARAHEALAAMKGLQRGTVTFGTTHIFASYFFPAVYETFRRAYPAISVRVEEDQHRHILDGVARRQLDLAVVLGPIEQFGLINEPLIPCYMVAVGPPGHRLAGILTAPFNELAQERMILGDRSSHLRGVLDRMAVGSGISLNVVLEVNNADARLKAVLSGAGVTILSIQDVAAETMAGRLCILRIQGFPIRVGWFVVYLPIELSVGGQAFRRHLLQSKDILANISSASDRLITESMFQMPVQCV